MPTVPARLRRRFRARQSDSGSLTTSFEHAALHLRMLVAMAAADGRLRTVEIEALHTYVEGASVVSSDRPRLERLLEELLDAPEPATRLIAAVGRVKDPAFGRALLADLMQVSLADEWIDPREQDLIDAVRSELGLDALEPAAAPTPDRPTPAAHTSPAVSLTAAVSAAPRHVRPERRAEIHVMRAAVRAALERSYAATDRPFGV